MATLAVAGLWARAAGPATAGDVTAAVRDQGNQPVEDVVVLAAPEGRAGPLPEKPGRAIMDQFNKTFVPEMLPIAVGTQVRFPNRDQIRHHVYSFSRPKRFELPLYKGEDAPPVLFDKPGVVRSAATSTTGCRLHLRARSPLLREDRRRRQGAPAPTSRPAPTRPACGTRAWRGPKRRRPVP